MSESDFVHFYMLGFQDGISMAIPHRPHADLKGSYLDGYRAGLWVRDNAIKKAKAKCESRQLPESETQA